MIHDRYAVAELVGLLDVVGGEQDRLTGGVHRRDHVPQPQAALRIQPDCRLVEEDHAGTVHHRTGEHQLPGHPPDSASTWTFALWASWKASSHSSAAARAARRLMPK